jgi:hypothetical protein
LRPGGKIGVARCCAANDWRRMAFPLTGPGRLRNHGQEGSQLPSSGTASRAQHHDQSIGRLSPGLWRPFTPLWHGCRSSHVRRARPATYRYGRTGRHYPRRRVGTPCAAISEHIEHGMRDAKAGHKQRIESGRRMLQERNQYPRLKGGIAFRCRGSHARSRRADSRQGRLQRHRPRPNPPYGSGSTRTGTHTQSLIGRPRIRVGSKCHRRTACIAVIPASSIAVSA